MNQFWQKFKHRNVAKVAAAYAGLSWVLLQAQEAVLPTIGAPVWAQQTVLFLLLVGFPIACVIAWASDVSSDGPLEEGSESLKRVENRPSKLNGKTIALGTSMMAVIALFAFYVSPYVFDFEPRRNETTIVSETASFRLAGPQSPRFELNLGSTGTSEWGLNTEIAISPNGRYVAFTKNGDGAGEVFVRDLYREGSTNQVAEYRWGTDVHGILNFSEDGEWIAYFDSGVLKRVRVSGGASQNILEGTLGRTSGYHLKEGSLTFTGANDFIEQIDLDTGTRSLINGFDQLDATRVYRWPQRLPDGNTLLVSAASEIAGSESVLLLYDIENGEAEEIISNAVNGRFVEATGHIVFVRDSALWAAPFNIATKQIEGPEIRIINEIQTNGILGSAAYAFSADGRLVFLAGTDVAVASANLSLDVVSRSGEVLNEIEISGRIGQLDISPDHSQLSYTLYENADSDLWVWDFAQGVSGRRTFNGNSSRARWTSDSSSLIFNVFSETKELDGVWAVPSDGSSDATAVYSGTAFFSNGSSQIQSLSYSDDKLFFFSGAAQIGQGALWSLNLSSEQQAETVVSQIEVSPNTEEVWWSRISTSPNGEWVVYVSNESGANQIYIRPYPDVSSGKFQVSATEAVSPVWSQNSNELFFRSGNRFYSVAYEEFSSDTRRFIDLKEPELLFEHTIVENHLTFPAYVYNPPEDNFIILSTSNSEESAFSTTIYEDYTTLTVVENWFSELESLASRANQ